MSLQIELSKPEYQAGTYAERLALLHSKTESVVGKIGGGNTLHLVSMLARGLRSRIESCQNAALKAAWSEALQPAYLAAPAYSINVALPEIRGMLDAGLAAGVCTADEHAFIIQLATYNKQLFPNATLKDIVNHFEPALIDGQWHEIEETTAQSLQLQLSTATPEVTHIIVQWQAANGEWYHATAIHGLLAPVIYKAQIPFYGEARKLRWKCEYLLNGSVTAV